MAGNWASDFVETMDNRATAGGVDNLFVPAEIVSIDPPVLRVQGVTISRGIHIDPTMLGGSAGGGSMARMARSAVSADGFAQLFADAIAELAEVEGVEDKTLALLDALQEFVLEMKKFKDEEYPLSAGERVMVRQQGKDFYVAGRVAGAE